MVSKKVGSFFEPNILSRGEVLYAEKSVLLQGISDDAAKLSVKISTETEEKYKNIIFWVENGKLINLDGNTASGGGVKKEVLRGASSVQLAAYCNCPYHEEYNLLCKHNWASIKALEGTILFFSSNISKKIELVTLKNAAQKLEVPREELLNLVEGSLTPKTSIGESDKNKSQSETSGVDEKNDRDKLNSNWRGHLEQFKEKINEGHKEIQSKQSFDKVKKAEPWQEVVYALELPFLRSEAEKIELRLLQRTRPHGSDKWSKLKKFEVPYYGFFDKYIDKADDRELLKQFSENIKPSKNYSHYKDRLIFSPALMMTALKEISKTGRLVVLLEDTSYNRQEALVVKAFTGESKFNLKICENDTSWSIEGSLEVDGQSFDLSEHRIISGINVALCNIKDVPCLVEFKVPESLSTFYKSFLQLGTIVVPKENKNDFLNFIKGFLPYEDMELPEGLGIEILKSQGMPIVEISFSENEVFAGLSFVYDHQAGKKKDDKDSHVFFEKDRLHEKNVSEFVETIEDVLLLSGGVSSETNLESNLSSAGHEDDQIAKYSFPQESLVNVVKILEENDILVRVKGKKLQAAKNFSSRISSHINWFELNGEIQFGNNISLSMPQILKRVKDDSGLIRLDNGETGVLPEQLLKKLLKIKEFAQNDGESVRFDRSQVLILDGLLSDRVFEKDKEFTQLIAKLQKTGDIESVEPCKKFNGELRDYQKDGLSWMAYLEELSLGGCLADDMGLGKTIQVLSLLQKRKLLRKRKNKTSIIVIPKSLMYNWASETKKFTPNIKFLSYEGSARQSLIKEFDKYDVVFMTYAVLRIDTEKGCFKDNFFDYAILDEAQNIKNESSLSAKAACLIQATHRIALTGTPVENHIGDLFSIFRFLNPGLFNKKFNSYKKLLDLDTDEDTSFLLKGVRPFILRRKKNDVLKELPEKVETVFYCDLTAPQQAEYDKIKNYYRNQLEETISKDGLNKSKFQVLEGLTRLRQAACHLGLIDSDNKKIKSGKIEALIEQLKTIKEEGKKALVFSQFTSMLKIIGERLDAEGLGYSYLDGQTRKRQEVIEEFKTSEDKPLFLISLKAGGVGLNLVEASYCYIVDPWWNPAVESQAIDRAYRIGQKNKVMAYKLISRGTVEEKILELQNKKKKLYEDVLESDENLLRRMSLDDVQYLFS